MPKSVATVGSGYAREQGSQTRPMNGEEKYA